MIDNKNGTRSEQHKTNKIKGKENDCSQLQHISLVEVNQAIEGLFINLKLVINLLKNKQFVRFYPE